MAFPGTGNKGVTSPAGCRTEVRKIGAGCTRNSSTEGKIRLILASGPECKRKTMPDRRDLA